MSAPHFLAIDGVPADRLAAKLRELAYELHVAAYEPVRGALFGLYHRTNSGPMSNPAHGKPGAGERVALACNAHIQLEASPSRSRARSPRPCPKRGPCRRCGRRLPAWRASTGFCSKACDLAQLAEDRESWRLERELTERGSTSATESDRNRPRGQWAGGSSDPSG